MTDVRQSPPPDEGAANPDVPPRAITGEAEWLAYVNAARLAQQSLARADGIAAGRAWRRFLDTFLSPHQRDALHGVPPECS